MPGFGAKGGGTACGRPDGTVPLARSRSAASLRDEVAVAAATAAARQAVRHPPRSRAYIELIFLSHIELISSLYSGFRASSA